MMSDGERAAWLTERAGRLTASRMADAMSFLKSGKPSADRNNYMAELLAERVADANARHFVSDAMLWGLEQEEAARMAYEAATGVLITDPRTVANLGVFHHPTIENFAASPDGLIDRDGLIETKCPTTTTFTKWVMSGVIPEEHKPQMLAQLACTGRKWCEFVAFDPRIREPSRRLFVRRYEPTPAEVGAVEAAAVTFLDELDAMFDAFVSQPVAA